MNRKLLYLTFVFILSGIYSCKQSHLNIGQLTIHNPAATDFSGVVEIPMEKLGTVSAGQLVLVKQGLQSVASQWCDKDGDGQIDVLVAEVSVPSGRNASLDLSLIPGSADMPLFTRKTHAELWHKTTGKFKEGHYVGGGNFYKFDSLRVPDGLTDHSYFIKYEGPGWESDKVGYRFYLDWRNAVDVFGKKVNTPVLQQVGVDGYESYHHIQDWGMDVLKVGKSLGLGSIGWWNDQEAVRVEKTDSVICRILSDGLIRSQVQTWYHGWQTGDQKINLTSVISIDAGSRMSHQQLISDVEVTNFCTGIRKEPDTNLIQLSGEKDQWGCLATWGKQSLNKDRLGLAILYPMDQDPVITEDNHSHVIVFEKALFEADYYFLAAWELEKDGITNEADFVSYLKGCLNQLENPLQIH